MKQCKALPLTIDVAACIKLLFHYSTTNFTFIYFSDAIPQPDSYQYGPSGEVSPGRPGKKESNLSKKTKVEPRPPNESLTANVASATAPLQGQRIPPVGSEESANVGIVQPAAKSIQPPRPAQSSDLGYGTGTGSSNRKKGVYAHICCLAKCFIEIFASRQKLIMWMISTLLKVFLLKLLHVASPLLSPPILTLQLRMPTKMSSTAWLTSHSILNPTSVRHSVWVSTFDYPQQYLCSICVYFSSLSSHPSVVCAVHRSELTNGKTKRVSPMLKVLKKYPDPIKYFDSAKFLEALQLDSLLPRMEVDTSLYVTSRAKLEQVYPYLPQGHNYAIADVVYSTLKYLVSEEAEAGAVRDKCKQSPQLTCRLLCVYAFHSDTGIVSSQHNMLVSQLYRHRRLFLFSCSQPPNWMECLEGLPSHQVCQC